jgi:aryl-alcohol dehydrogenase-like predicted oxidoreductase
MVDEKLNRVRELTKLAEELGVSLSTLSIAWTTKNPNVTTAILGATKKEQLIENLKALEVAPKLTPDVLIRIDDIMQTAPKLPEY